MRGDGDDAAINFASGQRWPSAFVRQPRSQYPPRRLRRKSARSSTTPSVASLGRIELRGVTTTGRVQILARDKVRGGHVDVNGLDIIAADARGEKDRPHGYGVYVLQGAFTLWNMQPDDT